MRIARPEAAGPAPVARPVVARPAETEAAANRVEAGSAVPVELLDLVERLDSIADRLADMEQPGRPLPANREIYGEWVRLRKWEEMPFAEFLSLRRAGRV